MERGIIGGEETSSPRFYQFSLLVRSVLIIILNMKKAIYEQELTELDNQHLSTLKSNQKLNLVSNEDAKKAWIDDGKKKQAIPYNTYLRLVYNKKMVCFRYNLDNCIFWHKAQDDENPWTTPNGVNQVPAKIGLYEVMGEHGDTGEAFCSRTFSGVLTWVTPFNIACWREKK